MYVLIQANTFFGKSIHMDCCLRAFIYIVYYYVAEELYKPCGGLFNLEHSHTIFKSIHILVYYYDAEELYKPRGGLFNLEPLVRGAFRAGAYIYSKYLNI